MNYNHLYKYNRIYHLYKAVDNTWHVESYPIVYMNDTYLYFKVPGSKILKRKVNNSCYDNWELVFDQDAKDRIKRDYEEYVHIHRGILEFTFDGGYYLNIDVSDAKDFCKELTLPDSRTAKVLELEKCKTWLDLYGHYERDILEKRQRVKELEEQLLDKKGIDF